MLDQNTTDCCCRWVYPQLESCMAAGVKPLPKVNSSLRVTRAGRRTSYEMIVQNLLKKTGLRFNQTCEHHIRTSCIQLSQSACSLRFGVWDRLYSKTLRLAYAALTMKKYALQIHANANPCKSVQMQIHELCSTHVMLRPTSCDRMTDDAFPMISVECSQAFVPSCKRVFSTRMVSCSAVVVPAISVGSCSAHRASSCQARSKSEARCSSSANSRCVDLQQAPKDNRGNPPTYERSTELASTIAQVRR